MSPAEAVPTATARLAELRAAVAAANVAVRAVDDEHRAAQHAREELRGAVVNAWADGDAHGAQRIADDLAALDDRLADDAPRVEGARLAASRAADALGRFASERLDDLLAEQREAAERARAGVAMSLRAFETAVGNWNAAASDALSLARLAGRPDVAQSVPSLPASVDYVLGHAQHIDDTAIPAPFPRTPVVAVDGPDADDLDALAA